MSNQIWFDEIWHQLATTSERNTNEQLTEQFRY